MKMFLLGVEFLIGISLIAAILLHSAKGEGLGGIGGQAQMFGSQKGMEAGLNRITTILAVSFLVLAMSLSILF